MAKFNVSQLICILLTGIWLSTGQVEALKIKKISQIGYDYEIAFFLIEEDLLIWDAKKCQLLVYHENFPVKTVKLEKGQAPREIQVLSIIFSTPAYFVIWDRAQRRFSFFNKDWQFVKMEKLPQLGNASPLGFYAGKYVFQWSDFVKNSKGSEIVQNIGLIDSNGKKSVIKAISDTFNDMGAVNYNRPFLISVYANDTLYYANNQEYKIFAIDLKKLGQPSLYLQRAVKPIGWRPVFSEMQYEIFNKPTQLLKYVYPDYLPPILTFFVDGDTLGVVSNLYLLQKKSVIDFFKKEIYVGTIEIPLICSQYTVFPSLFYFNPGIYMKGKFLYTLNYDTQLEIYQIIKWELQF